MHGEIDGEHQNPLLEDIGVLGPPQQLLSIPLDLLDKLLGYDLLDALQLLLIGDVIPQQFSHEVGVVEEGVLPGLLIYYVLYHQLKVEGDALPVEVLGGSKVLKVGAGESLVADVQVLEVERDLYLLGEDLVQVLHPLLEDLLLVLLVSMFNRCSPHEPGTHLVRGDVIGGDFLESGEETGAHEGV